MLAKIVKASPNVFSQALRCPRSLPTLQNQYFSSLNPTTITQSLSYKTTEDTLDNLPTINPHINTYMKDLYPYLTATSIIGISSAHLLALTIPVGLPPAFLALAGLGLQHFGSKYVHKSRPTPYIYRDDQEKIQHSSTNSTLRKVGLISSCLGYSCIIGSLVGMIPLSPVALPVSAITCMFSTLGNLFYCKFTPQAKFKKFNLFASGLFGGVLGLNFLQSSSMMLMLESSMHLNGLGVSTYLGMLIYNAFAGYDSQKTVEDVRAGKGDYLEHANKFSENWLYSLIPYFLMGL